MRYASLKTRVFQIKQRLINNVMAEMIYLRSHVNANYRRSKD